MAPVLKQTKSKIDGHVFIGLSLSRKSAEHGHPDTVTHQTAFDFNDIADRNYEYVFSTDDDGWLVGGGEPGPPKSYKLPSKDTAHVELMRVGTFQPEFGGISEKEIIDVLNSGKILIPHIEVLPSNVRFSKSTPPELEVRFDMPSAPDFKDMKAPLPHNWQLKFIHNQLFKHFTNPSRFCPGPFHMTIARKVEFRSANHADAYFAMCEAVLKKWRLGGPRPLNDGAWDVDGKTLARPGAYNSGIWLFQDRTKIMKYFAPNFLPPYDTKEKREIILSILTEEWDEKTLSWKTADNDLVVEQQKSVGHSKMFGSMCNPIETLLKAK